jgi:hypothetical protein
MSRYSLMCVAVVACALRVSISHRDAATNSALTQTPRLTVVRRLTLRGGDSDLSLDNTVSQDTLLKYAASESFSQHGGSEWPTADADATDIFRGQIVRLMVQAMDSYGFPQSARSLELESGVALHPPPAREALDLQTCLLHGNWQRVESLLQSASWATDRMKYLAYKQMYLEMIQAGNLKAATRCFKNNLQPAARSLSWAHKGEVQKLKLLLSKVPDFAVWSGSGEIARERTTVKAMLPRSDTRKKTMDRLKKICVWSAHD